MAGDAQELAGPDLSAGLALTDLAEGVPLLGHMDGEAVMVVRHGDDVVAMGATCTHYGGPLTDGLVTGETVRCPWHHACFSLRTGEPVSAPALNPLPHWDVEVTDGRVVLGARREEDPLSARGRSSSGPDPVVIIGAGAAGSAAAEMLRREGYGGRIVLVDPDPDAPYDRPNLSKDYLAGSAPEEWIPLRSPAFYEEHGIERVLARATAIDAERALVRTSSGDDVEYGALLIATGAVPRTLNVPGADLPHVHTLRSLADSRRIIQGATSAQAAVVIGASFIGMEVAASLRARGLEVSVVAPEAVPFERTLGPEVGRVLQNAHERNGVALHLGRGVVQIDSSTVTLDDGTTIPAQLVVVGIGVMLDTALPESAGLDVDNGILVDEFLRTSDRRIHAAGDVARWIDPATGRGTRIEHWVVAQRQGQAAARNILGRDQRFGDVPFFWTQQFDVLISYVGHAARWDEIEVDGDPAKQDAEFRYIEDGRTLALATIGRDRRSLEMEVALAAFRGAAQVPGRDA